MTRAARGLAALYLAVCTALLACTIAPVAIGWRANVLVTGSMAPGLPAGTVLMTDVPSSTPRTGDVVVVRDDAAPGGQLAHRVIRRAPDGRLVLRGDANRSADAQPVSPADVRGVARLAVPYVGLPAVWARDRRLLPFSVWILLTAGATALVLRRRRELPQDATAGSTAPSLAVRRP